MDTPEGPCNEFRRYAFQLLDNKSVTLVHYCGDEKVAIDFVHGNTKYNLERKHVRSTPSCLSKYKDLVKTNTPNIVYKRAITDSSDATLVNKPRNLKQIRNLRYQHLKETRISQDTLYNIHEIAYDLPGFIWKLTTYPDLLCICGLKEVLSEFDRVLHIDSKSQILSYDTTFQLGDFYVSPLIFRHSLFKENPCIPAIFLIHERKYTETHQDMWRECCKQVPSLKTMTFPIVTDKEKAIINAICNELPNVRLLQCWNHIFRDVRLWCRNHGAPKADVSVYVEDLRLLFHTSTEKEYEQNLKEKSKDWDALFAEYYLKEIHLNVSTSIGRWILEECNVYNPYSGVTNNQSESMNRCVFI